MSQNIVKKYNVSNAVFLHKPALIDTVNMKGVKYDSSMLLDSKINNNVDKTLNIDTVTQGDIITFPNDTSDYQAYLVEFYAISPNYVTDSLKITSPNMVSVSIDGKKVKDKKTEETGNAKSITIPFVMQPEHRYTINIKLITSPDKKINSSLKCEVINTNKNIKIKTGTDIAQRYSLYNTVFGNRVLDSKVSPNGKYMITYYKNMYDVKHSDSYTTLSLTKSGDVLFTYHTDRKLKWMPQSNKLYYTLKYEDDKYDVYTIDPSTLKEEKIIKGLFTDQFSWSPNEKLLILINKESAPVSNSPVHRIAGRMDRVPGSRNGTFLSMYDIKTGITQKITYGYHSSNLQDIRYDGKKLLYMYNVNDIHIQPFTRNILIQLDLTTLKTDTLVTGEPFINSAHYSPDGKQLLITGGPSSFDKIGLNCVCLPIPNDFDIQAYIMNLADLKVTPISKNLKPSLSFLTWNKYDNNIYFKAIDKDLENVYRYNTKKHSWLKLPIDVDVIRSFSIALNSHESSYTGVGMTYSTRAYKFDISNLKSILYADPMKKNLDEINLGKYKEYNYEAEDGNTIYGTLCLPPDFDANKKYPLIVYYYGGTLPTPRLMDFYYSSELFASRDYVVYVLNPSGTIGYGQEFSARHVNAYGKWAAKEIINGVKKVCADNKFINKDKIGCIGASYGGFMTMYLQTVTDIFDCAISHSGISNIASYWGQGYWGVGYNAVAASGSYPWNNPEFYVKQSPLFSADKIHTPMLLLQGTKDTNVPLGESIQLFNALKVLNRPVEYVQIDGEDHCIRDYAKKDLWHKTIMAWFAKWLQDRPEWWDSMYHKIYTAPAE